MTDLGYVSSTLRLRKARRRSWRPVPVREEKVTWTTLSSRAGCLATAARAFAAVWQFPASDRNGTSVDPAGLAQSDEHLSVASRAKEAAGRAGGTLAERSAETASGSRDHAASRSLPASGARDSEMSRQQGGSFILSLVRPAAGLTGC